MSHFFVLVIGPDAERQLAPYHEFECTGRDDEFVKSVDITEEAREQYASDMTTYYQDPEGNLHSMFIGGDWDPQFFRDPTPEEMEKHKMGEIGLSSSGAADGIEWYKKDWGDGRGYRAKVKSLPEGWKEVKANTNLMETFAEWVEGYYGTTVVPFGQAPDLHKTHKYGYILVDEAGNVIRIIDRTNPNAHWDWFQVGGRWNGFFKLKPQTKHMTALGRPGLQTMNHDYKPPERGRADVCRKGDIDIDGMRNEVGERAAGEYDKYTAMTGGCSLFITWKETQEKNTVDGKVDWEKARTEYNDQPVVKALRADRDAMWWDLEDFQCSREEYIEHARAGALRTFAVVKDSLWFERGRMGWWGCVHDEKDDNEWTKQFSELIDSLPDDTLLTVADCHI